MNKLELKNSLDKIDRRFIDEALEPSAARRRTPRPVSSPWGRLCAACLCVAVILTAALVLPGIAEYHRGAQSSEPGHFGMSGLVDMSDSVVQRLEPTVSNTNIYEFVRELPAGVTFYYPKELPEGYSVVLFEYFTFGESAGQSWVTVTYTDGTADDESYEHTITVETICYDSAEDAERVFRVQYGDYANSDGVAVVYSSGEDDVTEAGDEIISSQPVRLAQLTWVAGEHFIVRMQLPAIQNMLDYIDMKYWISNDGDGVSSDAISAAKTWETLVSGMQMTEEQLALDTPQLLQEILESEYFRMISGLMSSLLDLGNYELWLRDLNGLAELETRADAVEVLLAYYASVHPNGYEGDSWCTALADVCVRTILARGASGAFYDSMTAEQRQFVGLE